jgi:hypothetical protein
MQGMALQGVQDDGACMCRGSGLGDNNESIDHGTVSNGHGGITAREEISSRSL